MYVLAASAVSSTGLSAELAQWAGRLTLLLLIVLLVRKFVFKKDSPQIGRGKHTSAVAPSGAVPPRTPGADAPAPTTILPD